MFPVRYGLDLYVLHPRISQWLQVSQSRETVKYGCKSRGESEARITVLARTRSNLSASQPINQSLSH
jgi:hypothetical protein